MSKELEAQLERILVPVLEVITKKAQKDYSETSAWSDYQSILKREEEKVSKGLIKLVEKMLYV